MLSLDKPLGEVENAIGRIRRWSPRGTDLDTISEDDIQDIAMTINLTPRKCLGYRSPVEAFLSELGAWQGRRTPVCLKA